MDSNSGQSGAEGDVVGKHYKYQTSLFEKRKIQMKKIIESRTPRIAGY